MHFLRALCVLALLALSCGRGLGVQHQPREDKARSNAATFDASLPGGVQSEPLSSTDREHLDLYNYVVQLFAQQAAANASYNAEFPLPFNNSGVKVTTEELMKNGFKYKEFYVPPGSAVSPEVNEVLFIYQKFPSSSTMFSGVAGDIVSPIVGLACYTLGDNSSVVSVTPPATQAIVVTFGADSLGNDQSPMCHVLDTGLTGLSPVPTSPVATAVTCKGSALGTYCVTSEPLPPAAAPAAALSPTADGGVTKSVSGSGDTKVVVGATLGTIAGLALLAILLLWGYRSWHRQKIARMERESERGETLQTALMFGGSRAPAAGAMRTKPRLEDASIMEEAGFLGKGTGR